MRHLLFAASLMLVACASEFEGQSPGDDPADVGLDEPQEELTTIEAGSPTVRVAQLNPYYAGRLAPYTQTAGSCSATADCGASGHSACMTTAQEGCYECIDRKCRARTYETAKTAARLFDLINADVVGVEEMNPPFAPKLDTILETATGVAWDYRMSEQGINGKGSGVAVYWRTDRIELVADLGKIDVGTLASGYLVRFHGALLRPRGTQKLFGFFSGKLDWNRDDSAIRKAEAIELRKQVNAKMAPFAAMGAKVRIVASDFNDTVGSDAYDVFANYDDGDAVKPTSNAADPDRRIDYLLWADGPGGASQNGFVGARSDGRLGRSMFFGSDHRFVYGDARIP